MKLSTTATLLAAAALLSGCAVYPAGPGGGNVYYDDPGYYRNSPGPLYYGSGPGYGPPPVYYAPAPIIINRDRNQGNWDRDRRGDRERYDRDGRGSRPSNSGGGRPQGPPPPQAQPTQPPRPGAQNFRYINPDGPQPSDRAGAVTRPSGDGNRGPRRND